MDILKEARSVQSRKTAKRRRIAKEKDDRVNDDDVDDEEHDDEEVDEIFMRLIMWTKIQMGGGGEKGRNGQEDDENTSVSIEVGVDSGEDDEDDTQFFALYAWLDHGLI